MPAFFASANRPKDAARWPDENDPFLSPPTVGWNEAVPGFEKLTAEQQATLIRDFLYTIPDGAPWPARGQEESSVLVDPAAGAVADQAAEDKGDKKADKKAAKTGALPGPMRF
jgi:hypothetical protein